MKVTKKVIEERERTVATLCDRCGVKIISKHGDAYHFFIDYREGCCDPDGGGEGYEVGFDFCQECAQTALIQLLKVCKHNKPHLAKWEC